jgi:hypothetical protein
MELSKKKKRRRRRRERAAGVHTSAFFNTQVPSNTPSRVSPSLPPLLPAPALRCRT